MIFVQATSFTGEKNRKLNSSIRLKIEKKM